MRCKKCNHTIKNGENYIILKDGDILCEDCFLEYSLEQFDAIIKQNSETGK